MIDKIKQTLLIDHTEDDLLLQSMIESAKQYVRVFTRNDALDFENDPFLETVCVYLVSMFYKNETSIGTTAGKKSENMGVSIQYIDELPKYLRDLLHLSYYRVNI